MWGSFYRDTDYLVVNAVCRAGKQLGVGQTQHAACYRNKDPLKCPVSHLGWLLFWRMHHEFEPYPDFTYRSAWYRRRVLSQQKNCEMPIANSTYDNAIKAVYEYAGVPVSKIALLKKRHMGRNFGSQFLQQAGVQRPEVGSFGGWQDNTIYNFSYLFQLGGEALHAAAHFDLNERIRYPRADCVSRDDIKFKEWVDQIFPPCLIWRPLLGKRTEECSLWQKPGADDSRTAADAFNELLVRVLFLYLCHFFMLYPGSQQITY